MGKLWSGFKTLADGCRRLFKKTSEDEAGSSKDETSGVIYDSVSQIIVKLFSGPSFSEAGTDIVVKEIKAFQNMCGTPKEKITVKGTLFLRLTVDFEDITNVCDKLWRLSRSKVPEDQLIDYNINVSLFIIKDGKGITTSRTRTAVKEFPRSENAELEVEKSAKASEIALTMVPYQESKSQSKTMKNNHDLIETRELELKNEKIRQNDKNDDAHIVSKILENTEGCGQDSEAPESSVLSDKDCTGATAENVKLIEATNDKLTQDFEEQTDGQVAMLNEEHVSQDVCKEERVSQDASMDACMDEPVSQDASMEACVEEPVYQDASMEDPVTKSETRKTGKKMGAIINAEAVMRRLSRLVTSSLRDPEFEWNEIDESMHFCKLMYKSFKTSGILARVQDEISGLKCNNIVWIKETMKKVKKSAKVLAHLQILEFKDLHNKYPDLISLEKYINAKENQFKKPKIRQKYIALILFGSLEKKIFFTKFPGLANEIISYDAIRFFIKIAVKYIDPFLHSEDCGEMLRLVQRSVENRYNTKKKKKAIADESRAQQSEDENSQHQNEVDEVADVDTGDKECSGAHGDVKDDGDDGIDDETTENERDASMEIVPSAKDGRRKIDRIKSTATASSSAGESTYEENWSFERDGINSLDDRIRTKRYGKGSKNRFENVKVKVKTRGVANRHIHQTKQKVLVEDAPEVTKGDDIFQMCQNLLEDSAGDSVDLGQCYGRDKEETSLSCSIDAKDVAEEPISADFRHIESKPSTIIMGKKLEMDDLGERYCATKSYATKNNKNRRQRKKPQRSSKVLSIGDLNNSALADSDSDDLEESPVVSDEWDAAFSHYYDTDDSDDSDEWTNLSNERFADETAYGHGSNAGNLMKPRIVKDKNILFMIYQTKPQL